MASATPTRVFIDTSVLINFLAVDRADLLAAHPLYRFVVTDHVRGEITERDPKRLERFETALKASLFDQSAVTGPAELQAFAKLVALGRLGVGECAAIAGAAVQGLPVALDDRIAKREALKLFSSLLVLDTVAIVRSLIGTGALDIATADAIKLEWDTHHRFTLKFRSFGDGA